MVINLNLINIFKMMTSHKNTDNENFYAPGYCLEREDRIKQENSYRRLVYLWSSIWVSTNQL